MPPSQLAASAPVRSAQYLSRGEREELAILRAPDLGVRDIARRMQRSPSTISRELRRHAATRSGGFAYRATMAQWHADRASRRPKVARLATHDALRTYVTERLSGTVVAPSGQRVPGPDVRWKSRRHGPRQHRRWALAWSPEQLAHRLPLDFPDNPIMRIRSGSGGSASQARVVRVLDQLHPTRKLPQRITVDNGPECQSKALDAWAHRTGVTLPFSRPGTPVDNTFLEACNGRMRDECLNQSWFRSLPDARRTILAWRELYNTGRPHRALEGGTPSGYAAEYCTLVNTTRLSA